MAHSNILLRSGRWTLVPFAFFTFVLFQTATTQAAAPDLSGKVALANLDRYPVHLRFGKLKKEVPARKATVLKPKRYPVQIEYWSGNTKSGWKKTSIPSEGAYGFNYRRGLWTVTKLKSGKTAARRPAPRKYAVRRAPPRRRVLNADPRRWNPLTRVAWTAASIYQFVRDEQDRDLLRRVIIEGREEDRRALEDWLRDAKIAVPFKEQLKDAFDDLERLSDADWKAIAGASDRDWDEARADLGDMVNDTEWENITSDLADINTDDFFQDTSDLDLEDVDLADNLDLGDDFELDGDFDVGDDYALDDLDIDDGHYDLGGYDDFGGGGDDFGGDFGGDFGDDDFGDFGGFDDFDF